MSFTRIDVAQNTQIWLDVKKDLIGSADSAAAMGCSHYVTPEHFLLYKRSGSPPIQQNDAMAMGHAYEERIAQTFTLKTSIPLETDTMYTHKFIKWLSCSPDRVILCPNAHHIIGVVEIKLRTHDTTPLVPLIEHIIQVHQQMYILGLSDVYLCYSTTLLELRVFHMEYNKVFWTTWALPRLVEFNRCWKSKEYIGLSYASDVHSWSPDKITKTFKYKII
jgi:predicted phage-related endonuclease